MLSLLRSSYTGDCQEARSSRACPRDRRCASLCRFGSTILVDDRGCTSAELLNPDSNGARDLSTARWCLMVWVRMPAVRMVARGLLLRIGRCS